MKVWLILESALRMQRPLPGRKRGDMKAAKMSRKGLKAAKIYADKCVYS